MNRWRLADCGRRPGPFLTRRVEDNTTSSVEDVLRRPLEPTPALTASLRDRLPSTQRGARRLRIATTSRVTTTESLSKKRGADHRPHFCFGAGCDGNRSLSSLTSRSLHHSPTRPQKVRAIVTTPAGTAVGLVGAT